MSKATHALNITARLVEPLVIGMRGARVRSHQGRSGYCRDSLYRAVLSD